MLYIRAGSLESSWLNITSFISFAPNLLIISDFKSRAQELSNDVSFVIFGDQTWDLEGGPSIFWFSSTPAEIGLTVNSKQKLTIYSRLQYKKLRLFYPVHKLFAQIKVKRVAL